MELEWNGMEGLEWQQVRLGNAFRLQERFEVFSRWSIVTLVSEAEVSVKQGTLQFDSESCDEESLSCPGNNCLNYQYQTYQTEAAAHH